MKKIEVLLFEKITEKKLTLSIGESCTGGLISHLITNVSGSSNYFLGGVICYSNQSKIDLLCVKKETIKNFGTVSRETALEMAINICKKFKSDIGLSVTGIAGPSGGTLEKPVGLVFIGVKYLDKVFVHKFNFKGTRLSIKKQAAQKTLELLANSLNS